MLIFRTLLLCYTLTLYILYSHRIHIQVIRTCIILQIGNQRNYYLFMDGEELREVTKDVNDLMITTTGTLQAEQTVIA